MGFPLASGDLWKGADERAAKHLRRLLTTGETAEAHRQLVRSTLPIATEIMSLIRADDTAEAVRRLDLFLRPKFASLADCEAALVNSRGAA